MRKDLENVWKISQNLTHQENKDINLIMIPKIIHYCWLSDDPLPSNIQKYIKTWEKILPDYEIIKWDYHKFPRGKSKWVDEAFNSHKYAFAADYIRAYALYNFGGIYLDSDVEVVMSFDSLISYPYFMGYDSAGNIEAAVIGAEKGFPLFKMLLDYYNERNFIIDAQHLDTTPLPYVINSLVTNKFDFVKIEKPNDFYHNSKSLCILPNDYFSPKSLIDGKIYKSARTFTIHHYSGSWLSLHQKLYVKFRTFFGYKIAKIISKTFKKLFHNHLS